MSAVCQLTVNELYADAQDNSDLAEDVFSTVLRWRLFSQFFERTYV
jgi:hypothetical protein